MAEDLVERLLDDWAREAPQVDASAMAVVGRVIHLGRLLEARVTALLRPHRLSYSEFDILATLRRSGGECALTPTALRASVLLTSGAMTSAVDRLERKALVARERTGSDRRSVSVRLSDMGRELTDALIAVRFHDASEIVKVLAPTEAKSTGDALKRLINQVEALGLESVPVQGAV